MSKAISAEDKITALDRMRYTKDKTAANLTLIAIVLDALFFVKLYQFDRGSWFYTWQIGASVIYNLLFLLIAFLCSEGCKNRQSGYMPAMVLLGVMQFVRIFYFPLRALNATIVEGETEAAVIGKGDFVYMAVLLLLSGVCMLVAAVTNTINNKRLNDYQKTLQKSA